MNKQPLFLDYIPYIPEGLRSICDLDISKTELEKLGFIFHRVEEDGLGISCFSYVFIDKIIISFAKKEEGNIFVDAPISKTTDEIMSLLPYIFDYSIDRKITWVTSLNNYSEIKKWMNS